MFNNYIQSINTDLIKLNFSNTGIENYILAGIIFVILFLILVLFKFIILSKLNKLVKKSKNNIDDIVVDIFSTINIRFYLFISFYFAILPLNINDILQKIINIILILWITYIFVAATKVGIASVIKIKKDDQQTKSILQIFLLIIKIILWSLSILMILSNLGINITSLIAGLGIGGVAIALALQSILGDLFSSFAIYMDKPFTVGDYIEIGAEKGIVEKIGIKTTRIRAMSGQQIILSNKEITTAHVHNYERMIERRVNFQIGLEYNTDNSKLKQATEIIKTVIAKTEDARFNRVHFKEFAESSLVIEIVYYVKKPDYIAYLNVQEKINYLIKENFEKEKIIMAFPTTTVHLASNSKNVL